MTALTRRAPSAKVRARGDLIARTPGAVVADPCTSPASGAWSAMVKSQTTPGAAYHVSHGRLIGWRCECQWWRTKAEICAHMWACMVLAGVAGFGEEDLA